jgi:hypothetical protein
MTEAAARRIVEYLRDRIGRELRTVVIVREADWEIYYLRDDLQREYTRESFGEVVDHFQLDAPKQPPDVAEWPVGGRRGVVHYHETAFVVQFPVSDTERILISLTPEVGQDLLAFMEACRNLIEDDG